MDALTCPLNHAEHARRPASRRVHTHTRTRTLTLTLALAHSHQHRRLPPQALAARPARPPVIAPSPGVWQIALAGRRRPPLINPSFSPRPERPCADPPPARPGPGPGSPSKGRFPRPHLFAGRAPSRRRAFRRRAVNNSWRGALRSHTRRAVRRRRRPPAAVIYYLGRAAAPCKVSIVAARRTVTIWPR